MKTREKPISALHADGRLYVDGVPYFMVSVQLDCDSCFTPRRIGELFHAAADLHCNTVAAPLYWRAVEPQEGKLDFSILSAMLEAAEREGLRMVLLWFGSYKNGGMLYAPDWVQEDTQRFRRAMTETGAALPAIACPGCAETLQCEQRTLEAIGQFLAEQDTVNRVILLQVNNESGLLGTVRCHCASCSAAYAAAAEQDAEQFSARQMLAYHEALAAAFKRRHPIPCYMNAWVPSSSITGSQDYHPYGGPDKACLPHYLAHKQAIDFAAPDIYAPSQTNFHRICDTYAAGQPLYIAEHSTGAHSRAELNVYYALAYRAIGFDPFALDRLSYPNQLAQPLYSSVTAQKSREAVALSESYAPLKAANYLAAASCGTPQLQVFVQEEGDIDGFLSFDDVYIELRYSDEQHRCRGCVIRMEERKFCILGGRMKVMFFHRNKELFRLAQCECGHYEGADYVCDKRNRRHALEEKAAVLLPEISAYFITLAE